MAVLDAWRAIVSNDNRTIGLFGDSLLHFSIDSLGSGFDPYVNVHLALSDLVSAKYGRRTEGLQPTFQGESWTFAGTPTAATTSDTWDRGPFGVDSVRAAQRLNTSSDIATYTVKGAPVSSLILHMIDGPSSANFAYSIDGGAFTNVSGTWTQGNTIRRITVTGPIATTLRVRGANAAGTAVLTYLVGSERVIAGSGAVVHGVGCGGAPSIWMVRSGSGNWKQWIDSVQPAIGVWLFCNDAQTAFWNATTFAANLQAFINAITAYGGECILMCPVDQATAPRPQANQDALRAAVVTAVANNPNTCLLLNFQTAWGGQANALTEHWLSGDVTHSTSRGSRDIASRLWGLLGRTRQTAAYTH